jgi:hypothetical protein
LTIQAHRKYQNSPKVRESFAKAREGSRLIKDQGSRIKERIKEKINVLCQRLRLLTQGRLLTKEH